MVRLHLLRYSISYN